MADQRYEIELSARVEKLERGMDDATRSLQRMGGVAEGLRHQFGAKLADAVVTGLRAIPQMVTGAVSSMIEMADSVTNLSSELGLGVEALQEYKFAGAAVGVGADDIGKAVKKLQVVVSKGSEDTVAALGAIGASGQSLKGMLPEQQLARVLKGLQAIPDPAQRTAIAVELIGMRSTKLIPLGEELEKTIKRSRELGVVMSSEAVRAADKLGDEMGVLQMTAGGLVNRLGDVVTSSQAMHDFVSGLIAIVADFSRRVGENKTALQDLVGSGLSVVGKALSFFLTLVVGVIQVIKIVRMAVAGWQLVVLGLAEAYFKANAALLAFMGFKRAAQESRDMAQAIAFQRVEVKRSAEDSIAGMERIQDGVAGAAVALSDLSNNLGKGSVKLDQHGDSAKKAGAGVRMMTDEAKKATEEMKRFAETLTKDFAQAGAEGLGGLQGRLATITADIQARMKQIDDAVKKGFDPQKAALLRSEVGRLGQSLTALALDAERQDVIGETFDDVAKKVANLREVVNSLGGLAMVGQSLTNSGLQQFHDTIEQLAKDAPELYAVLERINELMRERGMLTDKEKRALEFENAMRDALYERAAALQRVVNEQNKLKQEDVTEALSGMVDLLDALGSESAETVGALAGFFDSVDQMAADGIATWGELLSMAGQVISTFKKVTDSASGTQRALGGAAMGAKLGYQFGGAWGAAAGAAIGAVAGLLRKPSWIKAGEIAGKNLGVAVSKELAKEIEATAKKLNISIGSASFLNITKAMEESGKSANTFAPAVLKLMDLIQTGAVPAKQGMEELAKSFSAIREQAAAAGTVGDAALVAIIKRAREIGGAMYTPEMKQFVEQKLDLAVEGLKKLVGSMDDFKKSMESTKFPSAGLTLFGGDTDMMAKQAKDQATVFMGVFNALLSEKGLVAAVQELGGTFEVLQAKLQALGGPASEAANAVLAPFARLSELMQNDVFRGAAESADALRQIMVGLADAGYLDLNTFNALQAQAMQSFAVMTDQGATTQEALLALAPTIQAAISAAEQFGVPLSDDMQRLRGLAEQNGITFRTDPMERMVDVLTAIAVKLGAEIPASVDRSAASFDRLSGTTSQTFGTTSAEAAVMAGDVTTSWDKAMSAIEAGGNAMAEVVVGQFEDAGKEITSTFEGPTEAAVQMTDTITSVWSEGALEIADVGQDLRSEMLRQFQEEGTFGGRTFAGLTQVMGREFGKWDGIAGNAVDAVLEELGRLPRQVGIDIHFNVPEAPQLNLSTLVHGAISAAAGFYSPSMPPGPLPGGGTPVVVHPDEEVFVGQRGQYPGQQQTQPATSLHIGEIHVHDAGDPQATARAVLDAIEANYGGVGKRVATAVNRYR